MKNKSSPVALASLDSSKAELDVAANDAREDSRPEDVVASMRRAPSWSKDLFESDVWRSSNPNPSYGDLEQVTFASIPASFRVSCKEMILAMDRYPERGRKGRKTAGSAKDALGPLGHFARFLDAKGFKSFASASMAMVEAAHLDYCGLLSGKPTTSHRARGYVEILGAMHRMGPLGLKLLIDAPSMDPSKHSFLIGKTKILKSGGSTPELSESTARELLTMGIDWVENKAPMLIWMAKAADRITEIRRNDGLSKQSLAHDMAAVRAYAQELPEFWEKLSEARSVFGDRLVAFTAQERYGRTPKTQHLTDDEFDALRLPAAVSALQKTMQGFCYVVCAGFNGWRGSEVLSIQADGLAQTPSGHLLGSKVRKTGANPEQVIERPVPPIVAQAVEALSELNKHFSFEGWPHEDEAGSGPIFKNANTGKPVHLAAVSDSINDAWRRYSGDAGDVHLRSHQFRRFFAQFFLRRHQGNLDAVRRHFRHVSRDMIWAYAHDSLNAEYLVKEKKSLAMEIAKSVVEGEGYSSIAVGKSLVEVRKTLKLGAKVLSVEDAAAYIDKQIEEAFADVHAMEWGYCLVQRMDKGAACEGQSGPIEDRAEPSVCGRCKFLCTGQENVEFWQQTALLHQAIVQQPHSTKIMVKESERLLSTAANILSRHMPSNGGP